jgi:hypothetical protein
MGLISGSRSGSLLPKEQVIEPRKKQLRDARDFSYTYSSNQNASYRSTFVRPELAPDRPVGYDDFTTMVLAEGRINSAQCKGRHSAVGNQRRIGHSAARSRS